MLRRGTTNRSSGPKRGLGSPQGASGAPRSTVPAAKATREPRPAYQPRDPPPRPQEGLRSWTGRPILGRSNLCRPGLGLPPAPQARAASVPPAAQRPHLGLTPALRASRVPEENAVPGPARPPAPGPRTHSPAGWTHSPDAVAALPLSATLLAARPRDTRTAPARPGPG